MKQIDWSFNGGLPLTQDVLQWQRDGLKDALKAIFTMGYNGVPFALYGCYYDATTNDVTEGWIFDGDELIYFPGGNTTTAGTNLVKLVTNTTTVVFESGAVQPIYRNKEYSLDATGALNITTIRHYGISEGISIPIAITEASGSLNIRINTAARTIHFYGSIETLTATALASDGLQVKLIDDADIKAVMDEYYPSDTFEFPGAVMPLPGNSGVTNDLNGHPIQTVGMRFNNGGFYVYLRKTSADEYNVYFSHTILLV